MENNKHMTNSEFQATLRAFAEKNRKSISSIRLWWRKREQIDQICKEMETEGTEL